MKPTRPHHPGAHFARVFTGNAFEPPPRRAHQRPRPGHLRRTLRALLAWLLQPSPFGRRR
jgi:hypothetical protein